MANSTSEALVDAAVTAVTALAITSNSTALPVTARKIPSWPEGSSAALPQIVVSCGPEGRSEYLSATQKLKTYPVAVTIVTNTGLQLTDNNTVRQWRQQIELCLEARATWSGLTVTGTTPVFSQVDITNKAPFDLSALSKDFNYSMIVAEVSVVEARA